MHVWEFLVLFENGIFSKFSTSTVLEMPHFYRHMRHAIWVTSIFRHWKLQRKCQWKFQWCKLWNQALKSSVNNANMKTRFRPQLNFNHFSYLFHSLWVSQVHAFNPSYIVIISFWSMTESQNKRNDLLLSNLGKLHLQRLRV